MPASTSTRRSGLGFLAALISLALLAACGSLGARTTTPNDVTAVVQAVSEVQIEQQPARVRAANAVLRAGPNTAHEVMQLLRAGDALLVVGRTSDGRWLQVSVGPGALRGWIAAKLVAIDPTVPDVASAGPPQAPPAPPAAPPAAEAGQAPAPPQAVPATQLGSGEGAPLAAATPTAQPLVHVVATPPATASGSSQPIVPPSPTPPPDATYPLPPLLTAPSPTPPPTASPLPPETPTDIPPLATDAPLPLEGQPAPPEQEPVPLPPETPTSQALPQPAPPEQEPLPAAPLPPVPPTSDVPPQQPAPPEQEPVPPESGP